VNGLDRIGKTPRLLIRSNSLMGIDFSRIVTKMVGSLSVSYRLEVASSVLLCGARLLEPVARRPGERGSGRRSTHRKMDFELESDEALAAAIREGREPAASACREILFRRFYPKVSLWCRRFTGNDHEAADLTQDVFLRVHERLHTFREQSRFSTWLYTITRRLAINRGVAARRRPTVSLEGDELPEPVDHSPNAERRAETAELAGELRRAMARDLEPLEAKVLYLHHVDGMTLPAITDLLGLDNKSGAKAYIVNGRRKLHRKFGRWLQRQSMQTDVSKR